MAYRDSTRETCPARERGSKAGQACVQERGSSATITGHQQGIGSSARRPASQEGKIKVLTERKRVEAV